jgi:hypothetical protein
MYIIYTLYIHIITLYIHTHKHILYENKRGDPLCVRVDVYKYVYTARSSRCQPIQIVKVGGHLHVTITSPPPEPEVSVPLRAMIQSTQQAIHYTVLNQLSRTACAFLLLYMYVLCIYLYILFFYCDPDDTHTHVRARNTIVRGIVRRLIKITHTHIRDISYSNKIYTIFLSSPTVSFTTF